MNENDITNQFKGGTWNEEKIEQNLCLKYINSNNNVLELGSNIGHVSIIINILKVGM